MNEAILRQVKLFNPTVISVENGIDLKY